MIALGGILLVLQCVLAPGDELVLAPGGVVEADGPGPIVRYVADADGKVTFALDSYEMDAYLIVRASNGKTLEEAEGGGIQQNARIVLELKRGDAITLECTTFNVNKWSGKFRLSATAGDAPLPTGKAAKAIEAEFCLAYAERFAKRGDPAARAGQLHAAAKAYREAGLIDESAAAAQASLEAASALKRLDLVNEALKAVVRTVGATTHLDAAEASLARAERTCAAGGVDIDAALLAAARATIEIRRPDLTQASKYLDVAAERCSQTENEPLRIHIELARALIDSKRFRWPEAERRLIQVRESVLKLEDTALLAQCTHELGIVRLQRSRNHDAGIRDLERARGLFQSIHADEDALLVDIALVDDRLLLAAIGAERDPNAEQKGLDAVARERAVAIDRLSALVDEARTLGSTRVEARALVRLAEQCVETGDLERAKSFGLRAESLFRAASDDALGVSRAQFVAAQVELRSAAVDAAAARVESALSEVFANHTRTLAVDDAMGERTLIENWKRLAADVAAARIAAGADPGEAYLRVAPWLTTAAFEGRPRDLIEHAARELRDQTLRPGEVFLDFVRGTHEIYLFGLRRESVRFARLGDVYRFEDGVEALAKVVRDRDSNALSIVRHARDMGAALLAPIGFGADIERLVVGEADLISHIPFDVLIASDCDENTPLSAQPFLVRSCEVVSVLSWLAFVDANAVPVEDGPFSALIVGDPEPTGLPPLRGARSEALAVTRKALAMLGADESSGARLSSDATMFESPSVCAYLGRDATRDRVLAHIEASTHLHLAAHTTVDLVDSMRSAIVLANDEHLDVGGVLDTKLSARLTVLSACATSDGLMWRGNGIQSLAAAFLRAGSRGVVASLFPVDDAATEQFQREFYDALWIKKFAPAAAVRAAKIAMLDAARDPDSGPDRGPGVPAETTAAPAERPSAHPSRWAAFVYFGSAR